MRTCARGAGQDRTGDEHPGQLGLDLHWSPSPASSDGSGQRNATTKPTKRGAVRINHLVRLAVVIRGQRGYGMLSSIRVMIPAVKTKPGGEAAYQEASSMRSTLSGGDPPVFRPPRSPGENAPRLVRPSPLGRAEGLKGGARRAPLQEQALTEPELDGCVPAHEVREDESGEGEIYVRRAVFRETRRSLAVTHLAVIGRVVAGL